MADWPGWVNLALGSGIGAAFLHGMGVAVRAIANRKVTAATAADKLSDSAVEFMRQAGEDAKAARDEARAARQDADQARRDAAEARREATEARREAMDMARSMSRLRSEILSPYATIERLRLLVQDPPSANGNGTALVNR